MFVFHLFLLDFQFQKVQVKREKNSSHCWLNNPTLNINNNFRAAHPCYPTSPPLFSYTSFLITTFNDIDLLLIHWLHIGIY